MDQRTTTTAFGKQVVNPVVKAAVEHGLAPAAYAVLETTGRRSGVPRLTSVGSGPNGTRPGSSPSTGGVPPMYTPQATPGVRVKVSDRWYEGVGRVMPDDDPPRASADDRLALQAAVVRALGTDVLTVHRPRAVTTGDDKPDDRRRGGRRLAARAKRVGARKARPEDA